MKLLVAAVNVLYGITAVYASHSFSGTVITGINSMMEIELVNASNSGQGQNLSSCRSKTVLHVAVCHLCCIQ